MDLSEAAEPTRFIAESFKQLQDDICRGLEEVESSLSGTAFHEDAWNRPGGGGGRTRVLKDGAVWEKGGVNFSEVHGKTTEELRVQLGTAAESFWASGVSLVLHPQNPHVPIVHMNVRHFALSDGTRWFGGGIDLTPHYVDVDQARRFHRSLKATCDRHSCSDYRAFKAWADRYFFLPHRDETRGVGGIFFDHLGREAHSSREFEDIFKFAMDVGQTFLPSYLPLVAENHNVPFSAEEREWQLHRRGRYAEFNLVWDRGTRFGLVSNGRTESILMSLPPKAKWTYALEPGPAESETLAWLRQDIDWAGDPVLPKD